MRERNKPTGQGHRPGGAGVLTPAATTKQLGGDWLVSCGFLLPLRAPEALSEFN